MPFLEPQVRGAVEIYANGHEYDSIQSYQASKQAKPRETSPATATLTDQQENYIRQEAKKLGIEVDFSKVKTFQVNKKDLPDKLMHRLYVLSVEKGVVNALQDFYKTWGQTDFQLSHIITSQQLQEAIKEAVTASDNTKLLISEPGKVRIMDLSKGSHWLLCKGPIASRA